MATDSENAPIDRRWQADTKYEDLRQLHELRARLDAVRPTAVTGRVVNAFKRNLERVLDLGPFPAQMFGRGFQYSEVRQANAEDRSRANMQNMNEGERDAAFGQLLGDMVDRQSSFYLTLPSSHSELYFNEVENLANLHHALEMGALMSSMIVGSWTAHEVLTADLWETCLNHSPRLGFIAMNAEPSSADDEETRDRKERVKFEIPAHLLRLWRENLHERMGSLLKRKWTFSRRERAIDAYYKAFPEHKAKLKDILEHQGLRWIAALRNAVVHNGAIADVEFTSLVRTHPALGLVKEQEAIQINGKLVAEFVEVVVRQSLELIEFIKAFLANEQQAERD